VWRPLQRPLRGKRRCKIERIKECTLLESSLDCFYNPQEYDYTLDEIVEGENVLEDYEKPLDYCDEEQIELLQGDTLIAIGDSLFLSISQQFLQMLKISIN
jgi:hypothetical protein